MIVTSPVEHLTTHRAFLPRLHPQHGSLGISIQMATRGCLMRTELSPLLGVWHRQAPESRPGLFSLRCRCSRERGQVKLARFISQTGASPDDHGPN